MKVYIYKGGQSLVAKSGVGSAIRHQEKMLRAAGVSDGCLERGGCCTDQYRTARFTSGGTAGETAGEKGRLLRTLYHGRF